MSHDSAAYVLDFAKVAAARGSDTRNYQTAYGTPLGHSLSVDQQEFNREAVAQPIILGYLDDFSLSADSFSCSLAVKKPDSFEIAIPAELKFCLPIARLVGEDILDMYGSEEFHKTDILLIVKKSLVESGEAGRPAFERWHDHVHDRMPYDWVYAFGNALPTKFNRHGVVKHTEQGAVTRFGAEILHGSSINTGASVERVWGAFSVSPAIRTGLPMSLTHNPVFSASEDKLAEFRNAAEEILLNDRTYRPVTPRHIYDAPVFEAA